MAEPFIAEIRLFAYNFAPRGWAFCEGQLMPLAQNTALFSLVGTTYGGDGRTTFGLPDLRSRFAIGAGQGPGLSPRNLGERTGQAEVALGAAQLPQHGHALHAAATASSTSPAGAAPAPLAGGAKAYHVPGPTTAMASTVTPTGQSAAHENRQPALGLHYCIALTGVFPPRS